MQNYKYIRELREDHDLSQQRAANLLFVAKNTYIRYENGEREPPFSFMIRLANLYSVSLDWLAGRSDRKNL